MTFGKQITPLRRDDIPELSQFLIRGYGAPATSHFFSHEVLSWKYFDGPDTLLGDSICSLIARSAGMIIGHIGICPRQFIISGDEATPVSTMHAMDWLGSDAHPGVGSLLMLEALKISKTQFAVGGSEQAQALFPRLGFEQKPEVAMFRKVLSPFHRLRAPHHGLFGRWARTGKDIASVLRARTRSVPQTVELLPAPSFTEDIDCIQRQSSLRIVTCRRDHALFNYLLRFPLSGFSGWTIHTSQRMIGFAVLKITPRRRIRLGKIVDCWLDTEDPSCWRAAVAALTDHLHALSADDVSCYPTTPSLHAALLWNGFTKWSALNVYVRDKQQLLPRDLTFGLSRCLVDGFL